MFENSYWCNVTMLKYGHPRSDILFNKNNEFEIFSKKIKELYNIDDDVKICLFAPTYKEKMIYDYNIDFIKIKNALSKKFGGKWCICFRLHHNSKRKNMKVSEEHLKVVMDVTDYPDIQELLCACDAGITDYSSWMCDYVLTKRPGFLYIPDYEEYVEERGFYYPLETTPFPIAKNNNELYEKIINFDEDKYLKGTEKFLQDRGCFESGKASELIVEKIIKQIIERRKKVKLYKRLEKRA